jgi:drug/metabolite transporter (DMT)-like permease
MRHHLSPAAALLLAIPTLMWAGNAVVGRMVSPLVSPMTLNLLRWMLAFMILLPLGAKVLRRESPLWSQWKRFTWLSLFSIGIYNALQYLALKTSTAINVTLVAASIPVWMLLIGRFLFGQTITPRQLLGAALSITGVLLVLVRGRWDLLLGLHLVAGDVYILLAAMCWAYYSWLLAHPTPESASIRANWAEFLLGQMVFGLVWSALFAGAEWVFTPAHIDIGWPLAAALAFIAIGPAILAYATWGAGVARAGAAVAGFFINLTPLFTAILSALLLGEAPQLFHAAAFVLIVSGIVLSSRK